MGAANLRIAIGFAPARGRTNEEADPLAARTAAVATSILPLAYRPLDAPAPIAEQVGYYLPYRPSRISIPDAVDHTTALVESVAMGSIAAPIPRAVPQLPSGLVANGILSAAQLETLIYAARDRKSVV